MTKLKFRFYEDLFGEPYIEPLPTEKRKRRSAKPCVIDLRKIPTPLSISADNIPYYPNYDGDAPTGLIGFEECLTSTNYESTVHFFIDDRRFTRLLRHPDKYIDILKHYRSVIGLDFSILVGMSEEEARYSIAAGRVVANYLYERGVRMVPNVQWSIPPLYDVCFSGIPRGSMVAVNCTGIVGKDVSKYFWRRGYEEMLDRLNPSCIIRYGDKMPDEDEERSVYFPNERLIRLRGGNHGR